MKRFLIPIVVLFLLTATAVFAAEIESIQSSGNGNSTVREMALYEPDPASIPFFNQHKVLVYSRTSRNGEQTDVVRPGNFLKECFIGSDHKIHVRRCGNVAYQIGVEDEVVIQNGRDGKEGAPGGPGPKGDRGDRGQKGDRGNRGPAGTGTTIYNFSNSSTMAGQMGGNSAPMVVSNQLMGFGFQQVQPVKICLDNSTAVNITNDIANTLVGVNTNTIGMGPGNTTGSGVGNGYSNAGQPTGN